MVISTALVTRVGENGKAYLSREKVELGQPQDNQVLVRIHSIAQNPTDGEAQCSLRDKSTQLTILQSRA